MKQFTSHIDFSLTKKRLMMMTKRLSKVKVGTVWIIVLPVSVAAVIVFLSQANTYSSSMTNQEIWDSLPPTTYYDVELECKNEYGKWCGLFHPMDERAGIMIGLDGEPYTGIRNQYDIENDSLLYTTWFVDGKVVRTQFPIRDSTGIKYTTVTIPTLDEAGNQITSFYNNSRADSLVLKMEKIDTDSLTTHIMYFPNGNIEMEFHIRPQGGIDGLATIYNEQGGIKEQRLYENGEVIEKIK